MFQHHPSNSREGEYRDSPDLTVRDLTADEIEQLVLADGPNGVLQDHHLDALERWLDSSFRVPGTEMRFGLDGLVGLVPVVGDLATTGMSAVFVADAYKIGARKHVIAKMIANVGLDFAVGLIPVVGDFFDFAFKSNTKNLALLKEERRLLAEALRQNIKTVG